MLIYEMSARRWPLNALKQKIIFKLAKKKRRDENPLIASMALH